MHRHRHLAAQVAIIAAILLVWEAAARSGLANPLLLPPFSTVAASTVTLLVDGNFLYHLGVTSSEVLFACVIVVPLGIALGLALKESEYFGTAFRPIFYFLASVPKSVFLPIFILLFGIGWSQKVAFGVFQALFVLIIATVAAASCVPPDLIRVARANGATNWQLYREIYWPAMLPLILEGLRLGLIFNITGVVFAEMYVSRAGIGSRIAEWGQTFNMPDLFAGILLTAMISIFVNEALRWYERRVGRWRV